MLKKFILGVETILFPLVVKSLASEKLSIRVKKMHFGGRNGFVPRENEDFSAEKKIVS